MTMQTKAPTIAVIDDDPSVQRALGRLLGSAGYPVITFGSGRAFFDDPLREDVAVVVLDVHMPGWSGLNLQSRLLASGSTLPIIFITGRRNPEVRSRALRGGAIAYLEKPLDEDSLFDALARALELARR